MLQKKFFAGVLAVATAVTAVPMKLQLPVSAAGEASEIQEIEIEKTECSNPIGGYDAEGNLMYGGDPAVLVDGDTVYLYTGHDTAKNEAYEILEWMCYSTKDLKNWNYEGVIMKADKASISWTSSGHDAWAGQVAKYKDKYYFYYCTWDATSDGKQSIGVAVSDSPTGPFVDKGEPLVKGTVTTPETSGWNDIDPTVWIEKDDKGVEHRYLGWGNGKYYFCELNEDMISVKDLNGDGKITSGSSKDKADIIEGSGLSNYTEAPWLYRRSDEKGNAYGPYYMFYAYKWREEMAYATTDDLLGSKWTFGGQLMPPTATSNTNHSAVFDFKGKTYFVYHNGSLPGGSGFRRNACIAELHFNEDGTVEPVPETAVGIIGTTSKIYAETGGTLSHENFVNSSVDGAYPYTKVKVGVGASTEEADAEWAVVAGKADKTKASYVSIQSENKPGLYLTVNDDKSVTLSQDAAADRLAETAKKQTFRTVQGLGNAEGVSFESVSQPGTYLTVVLDKLMVTDGTDKAAATFHMNRDAALEKQLRERFQSAQADAVTASAAAEYDLMADDTEDGCIVLTRAKADAGKSLKVSVGNTVVLDTAAEKPEVLNETLTYEEQKTYEQIQIPVKKDILAANSHESQKDKNKKAITIKLEGETAISGTIYMRRAYHTENALNKLTVNGEELTAKDDVYALTVPYTVGSIQLLCSMADNNGYLKLNGAMAKGNEETSIELAGAETVIGITAVAEDLKSTNEYTLKIKKDFDGIKLDGLAYSFDFDNRTGGASARTKVQGAKPSEKIDVDYQYTNGVFGKAIVLDGSYGLKLCDAQELGKSYTISFWMKPDQINGAVDPTLAAGTFNPEYWLNLTFDTKIWSNQAGGPAYIATGAVNAYKAKEWQHVAVVVDSSVAGETAGTVSGKLFVDGVLVSSGDVVDGIMTNAGAEVYFGLNAWDAYFTGALDDVMLFNKALTGDEVAGIAAKNISVENAGTPAFVQTDDSEESTGSVKKVVIKKKGTSKAVKTLTVKKGKTVKLTANVTVTGNASKKVRWKSSNKKIAAVSSKGVVNAKKKGTVKITAVSKADSKKKCTITVKIK